MSESNNNIPMRITQLEEATSYPEDSYIPIAKAGYGTKKINTKVLTPKEKFVTDGIQLNDQVKGMIFSNFCDKVQTLDLPQIVFEQNALSGGTEIENRPDRIRSFFVDLSNMTQITISVETGFQVYAEFYNKNKEFISGDITGWGTLFTRTITASEKFVRMVMRTNPDGNAISPSDASNLNFSATIRANENFGFQYVGSATTNFKTSIYQKNGFVFVDGASGDALSDLPTAYTNESLTTSFFFLNINYSGAYTEQFIFNNSINQIYYRVFNSSGTVLRGWTKLINSFDFKALSAASDLHSGSFFENGFVFVASAAGAKTELPQSYQDANRTSSLFFLNIVYDTNYCEQFVFQNTQNEVYYRVVSRDGTMARTWTLFQGGGGASGSPKNKWFVLGDSISAGYFSITDEEAAEKGYTISYRPEGLSGVGAVWDSSLAHNYWGYANQWFLKRNLQPKAYPGQGYFRVASNSQNGIYVVKNTDFSDAGLITVAWGFNDWHYNQPRGNHDLIDSSVPYPTAGYDTSQIQTVNQAIWYCLGELIRKAPNAKIIVQTPMNGWLYGGDWDSNWGIGYEMSQSGKLSDIHDDIVYWANYYGLQILDMTFNNSMVNRRNIKDVLLDGSHPTDPCHQQLGRHVSTMLGYC